MKKTNAKIPSTINLNEIRCVKNRELADDDITSMAASIGNTGLINPITLIKLDPEVDGKKYDVIAGRCRYFALMLLERYELPPEHYRLLETDDPELISFVENFERRQLSLPEEVEHLRQLREHYDVAEIASLLGRSEKYIRLRLQFCNLIQHWQDAMAKDKYPAMKIGHYAAISRFPKSVQEHLHKGFHQPGMFDHPGSVDNFMFSLDQYFCRRLLDAGFPTGECADCPHRSLAEPWLFEELKNPDEDRCLDPKCWDKKTAAAVQTEVKVIKAVPERQIELVTNTYCYGNDKPKFGGIARNHCEVLEKNVPEAEANAYIVDGPGAGTYCRIRKNDHPVSATSGTAAPVVVEDPRERLEKRRWKRALEKLFEHICNNDLPEPDLETLVRLIGLRGVTSICGWDNDAIYKPGLDGLTAALGVPLAEVTKRLWRRIKGDIGQSIKYESETRLADLSVNNGIEVCKLLHLDWNEYLQSAIDEIPEPKSLES